MSSHQRLAGIQRELQIVGAAKEKLLGLANVHHVALGVTHDDRGQDLRPAIWLHTTGEVPGLDSLAKSFELPVEVIPLTEPEWSPVAEQGQSPRQVPVFLSERADPPDGGYQIGPNAQTKGSLGLFGYVLGGIPVENLAIVTAAHTFALKGGGYSAIARQNATSSAKDIISIGNPMTTLTELDIIVYRIDRNTRNWELQTSVALLGPVLHVSRVQVGMRVVKVGYQTGETSGTIAAISANHFSVVPDDDTVPISDNGDSGAAWVTLENDERWSWVGIHVGRKRNFNVAIGVLWEDIADVLSFQIL